MPLLALEIIYTEYHPQKIVAPGVNWWIVQGRLRKYRCWWILWHLFRLHTCWTHRISIWRVGWGDSISVKPSELPRREIHTCCKPNRTKNYNTSNRQLRTSQATEFQKCRNLHQHLMNKNKIIYIGSQATAAQGKEKADWCLRKKDQFGYINHKHRKINSLFKNHYPNDFLNDECLGVGNTNVENTLKRLNWKHTQLANDRGRCKLLSTCLPKYLCHVELFPTVLLHTLC
jgi:hypothetical protein